MPSLAVASVADLPDVAEQVAGHLLSATRVLASPGGEEGAPVELPFGLEPWGVGLLVFGVLVVALVLTLTIGKNR